MKDLACCIWALPGSAAQQLTAAAALGFRVIDVRPNVLSDTAAWEAATNLSLTLSCVAISHGLPEGASLVSDIEAAQALPLMEGWIADASVRGARTTYVVPPVQVDGLDTYGKRLVRLAAHAASMGVRLCIEHFPGSILPTAADTLTFLDTVGHPNLYLLMDAGHLSMSNEGFASTARSAGRRLGYLHLDDNDGVHDQHLGLTEGIITADQLQDLFVALAEKNADCGISLELHPQLPDPAASLGRSRDLLTSLTS